MVAITAFATAFAAIANFFYFASHPDSFVSEMAAYAVLGASSSSVVKPAVLMAIEYMSPVFESDYSKLILPRLTLDNMSLNAAPSISAISQSARWLSSAPAPFNRSVQLSVEPYNTVPLISSHPFAPKLYLSPGLNYLRNDTGPSECRPVIHWADSEYRTRDIPRVEDIGFGLLATTIYADYAVNMTPGMNPLSYGYCSITETSSVSNPPLNVTYIPQGLSSGKSVTSNATKYIDLKQLYPFPWTFSPYFSSEPLHRMDRSFDNQTSLTEDQLSTNWTILGTPDLSQVSLRAFDLETYSTPTEEKSANETWELSMSPTELPIASKPSKFSAPLVLRNDTCLLRYRLVTTWGVSEPSSLHNLVRSERNDSLFIWGIGALAMASFLLVSVFTYQYHLSSQPVEEIASHTRLPLSPPCWMVCQCKPIDRELGDIPILLYLYTMYDEQAPVVPLLDPAHVPLPDDVSGVLFELTIPMSPIFAEDQSFYDETLDSTMNSTLYESCSSGLISSESSMSLASLCGGLSLDYANNPDFDLDFSLGSDPNYFSFTFAFGINAQSSPLFSNKRFHNSVAQPMPKSENVQLRPSKRQRLGDEPAGIRNDTLDQNNHVTIDHNELDSTSCDNFCSGRNLTANAMDSQEANTLYNAPPCENIAFSPLDHRSAAPVVHKGSKEVDGSDFSPEDSTVACLNLEATLTKFEFISQGNWQNIEHQESYFDLDSVSGEDVNSLSSFEYGDPLILRISAFEPIGRDENAFVHRISPPQLSREEAPLLGIPGSVHPCGNVHEEADRQTSNSQGPHFDFGSEENEELDEGHGLQNVPRIIMSKCVQESAQLVTIPPQRHSRDEVSSLVADFFDSSVNPVLQQTNSRDFEVLGSSSGFDSNESHQQQSIPRITVSGCATVNSTAVSRPSVPRISRLRAPSLASGLAESSDRSKQHRMIVGGEMLNSSITTMIRPRKRSQVTGVPSLGSYIPKLQAVIERNENEETGVDFESDEDDETIFDLNEYSTSPSNSSSTSANSGMNKPDSTRYNLEYFADQGGEPGESRLEGPVLCGCVVM